MLKGALGEQTRERERRDERGKSEKRGAHDRDEKKLVFNDILFSPRFRTEIDDPMSWNPANHPRPSSDVSFFSCCIGWHSGEREDDEHTTKIQSAGGAVDTTRRAPWLAGSPPQQGQAARTQQRPGRVAAQRSRPQTLLISCHLCQRQRAS